MSWTSVPMAYNSAGEEVWRARLCALRRLVCLRFGLKRFGRLAAKEGGHGRSMVGVGWKSVVCCLQELRFLNVGLFEQSCRFCCCFD